MDERVHFGWDGVQFRKEAERCAFRTIGFIRSEQPMIAFVV